MIIPQTVRAFIVDDHPVVRAGLRSIEELSSRISIVGEAGDATTALARIRDLNPHVVLLDIRLKDSSGIELCREIKAAVPGTHVLILTSYADDRLILSALEAGADGYLLKENDTRRLVNAILEVQSGESVFDPEITRHLANQKSGAGKPVELLATLTAQERRLLAEVAKGRTDKEAAVALGLSAKTVRNYLDRIFAKIGVHTRTEAAAAFIRAGERAWN